MPEENQPRSVELAVQLAVAWLGNPNSRIEPEDMPRFVTAMHETVADLAGNPRPETSGKVAEEHVPAVTVRKSLASKDHIVSMIDGKPYKTLKRHLNTHGLTPAEYIARYNLPSDYPMVAENYSAQRRKLAKQIGLGQKGRAASSPAASKAKSPAKSAPAGRRSRKPKGA